MQESRQLCLLINWSWCSIYSLLTPFPRGFISCGQSLNAFRVHAFVMSSAPGSVPLVPYLPWKEACFSALLTSKSVCFAFLRQGPWHPWPTLRDSPGDCHFNNPDGGRESTCPVPEKEQHVEQTELRLWNPSVLDSSPRSDTSSQHGLWTSHSVFRSQVNEKQKCPTLVGA